MGTVFTIDVRDPGDWSAPVAEVVAWLHRVDQTFSTYREDSAIRRLQRGELRLEDAEPEVVAVLGLCQDFERSTRGAFTSTPHGVLDPTGLVKGWAIERASELLRRSGSTNHAVNGGGDMQLAGESAPGRPWRVGISDPAGRQRLIAVVSGRDLAVATSGVAERGQHIVDPRTGAPADRLASVTIVGPHLTDADAYATAAFAMGDTATSWIEGLDGYEGLVVDTAGRTSQTSGFPRG
jgi:thiamine biosynthesis lipoprotein